MDDSMVLEGCAEDIIFYNDDNGYAVFEFKSDDGDEITCVGTVPQIRKGDMFKLTGGMVIHPSYGLQFKIDYYERTVPTTAASIEKYLASGAVKGIGPKTAKKIVDKSFIFKNYPHSISKISLRSFTKRVFFLRN